MTVKQEIQSESIATNKDEAATGIAEKTVKGSKPFQYGGNKKDTKTKKKQGIKLNRKNGNTLEESFQVSNENTFTSSTGENTIFDLQSTLNYNISDIILKPEEHLTTQLNELETTRESVTEMIVMEVTTYQQEITTFEGLKIKMKPHCLTQLCTNC